MNIAESFDFLLHAVLAWSASHLGQITGDPEVQQDVYRHRCLALGGLQQAIEAFSADNSDAVLCASIVLTWQSCNACVNAHSRPTPLIPIQKNMGFDDAGLSDCEIYIACETEAFTHLCR
jgi:hypothetical protein